MKQTITKLLGGAIFALLFLMPSSALAQTTLASWDFTKKYTTTDEGTSRYYTPSSDAAVDISSTNFSSITPYMYPNVVNVGNQSDYTISGGGSSWDIGKVNNEAEKECFRVRNSPLNSFDDITNKSTHNNWFEISFPTTGYKDIKFNIDFYYDLNEVAPLEYLISLDGGSTWLDGGNITSYGNWWMFKEYKNIALGVANQTSVKLRLIGKGSNNTKSWGIRTFSIVGTAISGETFYSASATSDNNVHGSVICSPVGGVYESGSSVTVTASNKIGWKFAEWQKGGVKVSDDNPYVFTINENTELTAIYEKAPVPAGTEVNIVEWTFNTPYSNSGNVYTPIVGDFTETNLTNASQLRPNSYLNTANATSYMGVNWKSEGGQYKTRINYSNEDQRCLALINSTNANNIDDYTDKNKHDGYFEASFSTRGFDNVGISFVSYRNANGASGTTPAVHVAYSVDEGSTWTDAGETSISSYWWVPTTITPTVSIDDKENVVVRIFPNNNHAGYWYIDNFLVKGEVASTTTTVSGALYSTYYNSIPVVVPANLQAATIDGETNGTLTLNYRYGEGDVIPGGTPVLLKATDEDTYTLNYAPNITDAAPAGNLLHGSDVTTTTTGGDKYYALMNGSNGLGFYYKVAGGAAFEIAAHKAWLALPATPAHFFSLDDDVTAINKIEMKKVEDGVFYNLAGQQVAQPTKGLYIVNGKKVVIK